MQRGFILYCNMRYQAGIYIELNSGFSSGNGFVAEIDPCVSNVTIIAAKTDDEYVYQQSEVETFHSEFSNNWIKLYPTILTSGSQLTIEANDDIDGVELQMFDMQGKHMRSFRLNSLLSGNTDSVSLDVPSGMYVLKAIRNSKLFAQKIVVQ